MGMNTVVVFLNDLANRWPTDIRDAMNRKAVRQSDGRFSCGQVISVAHSSDVQLVAVGGNYGRELAPDRRAEPQDLQAAEEFLLGHGYTISRPGETRKMPPSKWGFWQKQQDEEKARAERS